MKTVSNGFYHDAIGTNKFRCYEYKKRLQFKMNEVFDELSQHSKRTVFVQDFCEYLRCVHCNRDKLREYYKEKSRRRMKFTMKMNKQSIIDRLANWIMFGTKRKPHTNDEKYDTKHMHPILRYKNKNKEDYKLDQLRNSKRKKIREKIIRTKIIAFGGGRFRNGGHSYACSLSENYRFQTI